MPRSTLAPSLRITLVYLGLAALWIALSDRAVDMLVDDHATYVLMQTWKGWLFVAVTACLLFLLVNSALRKLKLETLEQQSLSIELATSRSIQAQLLDALEDLVWMLDLRTRQYLFINTAVENIYGVPVQTFMSDGDYWLNCVYGEDRAIAQSKASLLEQQGWAEVEYRIVRPDGSIRWLRDRCHILKNEAGQAARMIGIATDISTQRQHAEHIHRLSNYDSLTGLPNRTMLEGLLQGALEAARQSKQRVAVLYLDFSGLKDINDTYGHAIGDEVLRGFAGRLRSVVGPGEIIARLGADEFAMVLPELADGTLAGVTAQHILDALMVPLSLEVGEIRSGAAIGISLFPLDAETPATLLQHAGLALHQAKSRGGTQMCFYQPEMNAAVAERMALIRELHHALARNEIRLHYQPQIDLITGRIVAVEALMRWQHPTRGFISPAQFIPLAEESGLIISLGTWALNEACRQNRAWQLAGLPSLTVAVNVSAKQFLCTSLRDAVAGALAATQLEPHCLELEVTESTIMDSADHMLSMLAELRTLGVQLSIDDFGTGYSSLSYLTRFAVNKLKIDQAFVRGALERERDNAIVGIIVQMAKLMHLRVVAEGVETAEQAAMLKGHGCDEAQGYFYSRPLPADELESFLRERFAA